MDFYVSMQSPSLAGVRGIVSSGMGVTLINRGLMTDDQCEWPEARRFGEPPEVRFVVRATGMIPQPAFVATENTDPFQHPDAQRRFRTLNNIEELQLALEYPWEKWTVLDLEDGAVTLHQ